MLTARLVAGLAACIAAPALAQDAKPAPYTKGTVLVIDHADLDRFMASPKDRAMADALAMVPSRLREVGREAPKMPPEVPSLANMAIHALSRPGRFVIAYNGDNPAGGAYGYGAAFSFVTDKPTADEMHTRISALAAAGGKMRIKTQGTRFPGMSDIQTPFALLSFGPREAKDGWRYEVVLGTMDNPDAAADALPTPKSLPLPTGFEPLVRARMDMAGLAPALQMADAFAGQNPEATELLTQLRAMGIGGAAEGSLKVNYVAGHTKEASVSVTLVENARKAAEALGLTDQPLKKSDFAAIPADATDVYMRSAGDNWSRRLDEMVEKNPQAQEGLQRFQEATGVNLKTDVLAALGGTSALYLSDSTGGGTIGSAVVMISLRDRAKLSTAMGKLATVANMAADHAPIGPGYIRVTPWKDGDTELMSLRFPGLPVPLELTLAMTPGWLIAAPTPQGAIAAARQAAGKGNGGLTSNKAFAQFFPEGRQVTAFSYSDTARNMGIGYPIVSMLGSAVANAVRSPSDPGREPGLTVPLFNDLRKGVRPRIGFTYWRGDDMISESHSDPSALVNAAGTGGIIAKLLPVFILPAAAAGAAQGGQFGAADAVSAPLAFVARETVVPLSAERTALAISAILQQASPGRPE